MQSKETFKLESHMSLEDDMEVFGYAPAPGEKLPFGPPVLLVAGLRAEEVPRVRELLDELGGHSVKVLAVRARASRPYSWLSESSTC